MIKKITKKIFCVGLIIQCITVHGMFTTMRSRGLATNARQSSGYQNAYRWSQRPYQWQPLQLKGASSLVAKTAYPDRNFPASGAAVTDSGLLKNFLFHTTQVDKLNASDSLTKLTNELFQISPEGHISIVVDRNKVTDVLTPEFFGIVRGAQEKGLLQDSSIIKKIASLGKDQYATTKGAHIFPEEKIEQFLLILNQAHEQNPDIVRYLEDAYIFLRMNTENNHDLIHYLVGFNRYGSILSEQRLTEFKEILATGNLVQKSADEYNADDYQQFKDALLQIKMPSDQIAYARDNFPLAVSAIIQEKRNKKLYSPRVIMSQGSYENQPKFSTCGESAFRDLFNNMFFDENLGIFNPAGFFTELTISSDLLQFFSKYNTVNTINDANAHKEFIKLVSQVDGVTYVNQNKYEISSVANERNLISLCNHFFSLQVKNLVDLGKALSNDKRRLNFELISRRDNVKEIALTIYDTKTARKKYMSLYFQPGHSWFQTGDKSADTFFFDAQTLLRQYQDPVSRLFLSTHPQPIVDHLFFRNITKDRSTNGKLFPTLLFYAFPVRNDSEKSRLIKAILLYSKDKKAIDYARFLFKSLSLRGQELLADDISKISGGEQFVSLHSPLKRDQTIIE